MMSSIKNAGPLEDTLENIGEMHQLVSFQLGPEEYAIDILGVQEIIRLVDVTPVPNSPHYVDGVINLRGKVIPIINLRTRFGLPSIEPTKDTRIIVVEVNQLILGFMVDSVEEVLRIPEDLIEPPPSTGRGGADEFHRGVGRVNGRLLILLNLELLFGIEKTLVRNLRRYGYSLDSRYSVSHWIHHWRATPRRWPPQLHFTIYGLFNRDRWDCRGCHASISPAYFFKGVEKCGHGVWQCAC